MTPQSKAQLAKGIGAAAAPYTFGISSIIANSVANNIERNAAADAPVPPSQGLPVEPPAVVPNAAAQQIQQPGVWTAIAQAAQMAAAARATQRPSLREMATADFIRRGGRPRSAMGSLAGQHYDAGMRMFSPEMQSSAQRVFETQQKAATPSAWDRILQAAAVGIPVYQAGVQQGWWNANPFSRSVPTGADSTMGGW